MNKNKNIFAELIEKNQAIIHKVCRSYADTREEHEDLFQEIVLQLWNSFDSFRQEAKFTTWMYRVALNTAITLFRKKKRSVSITDTDEPPQICFRESIDTETKEQIDILYQAIKRLTEVERALVLLYLDERPYKEIAATIGISEVNARVKMNRIKVKLKEIMQTLSE